MGSVQSLSAAGTAGLYTPTPSAVASMMPWRSMAWEIACRTRTSLNGFWSVRKERCDITFEGNSAVWSPGRFCFRGSLIWTQSVRLMPAWISQPRSYLPARNEAMREALSSSMMISTRSMWGSPARKYWGLRTSVSPWLGR